MLLPLLVLFTVGLLGYAVFLTIDRRKGEATLSKISNQLPQSIQEKLPVQQANGKSVSSSTDPTYEEVFPPSRRHVLAELPKDALSGEGKPARELGDEEPDYSKLLPDKKAPNDPALPYHDHVTATGFTLDEIQRLGDFPDYATLSGIPLPEPNHEFDIKTAMPRPYRPFRWPYHQTMSLTKLDSDYWLELYHEYEDVVKQRFELFKKNQDSVYRLLPGSELAVKELMEMCLQFLCARYPHYFTLDKENMIFHNKILKKKTDLRTTPPLRVLLEHVPEDFAIMIRNPEDGKYSFRGGMIMSALGWSLGSKIGMQLHEIHAPIPDYPEKMKFSMDRYFAKKPTDRAIQRGSWGLEIDKPLYMPPGDPHELHRESQNPEHTLDQIHLRVDWQTLRRLPLSGAIIFNFKGLFTPITEFRDEAYIPSLILKVLREGKENIMEYKSTWHTEHVAIPALEKYEKEQIEKGLIPKDWDPKTLDSQPFYPGWEEKWHRQQGF